MTLAWAARCCQYQPNVPSVRQGFLRFAGLLPRCLGRKVGVGGLASRGVPPGAYAETVCGVAPARGPCADATEGFPRLCHRREGR